MRRLRRQEDAARHLSGGRPVSQGHTRRCTMASVHQPALRRASDGLLCFQDHAGQENADRALPLVDRQQRTKRHGRDGTFASLMYRP